MIVLGVMLFALDRAVKYWAFTVLRMQTGGTLPLWQNVLHLTYAQNEGASFGLLNGKHGLLIIIPFFLCAALLVILLRKRDAPWLPRLLGWTILAGALGNLYDRLRYGFVIDLFEVRLFRFAIFNVADTVLCIGIGGFALWVLFHKEPLAYTPMEDE